MHEAVVTKEIWQTANDIIDRHAVKAMKDKEKLTATVLNTLIEKIEVHNPVMVNGVKEQKLTVYYKFVGQID